MAKDLEAEDSEEKESRQRTIAEGEALALKVAIDERKR